ncbi:D-alanine--poly(phosphoribitol) ligase subunit DltA [Isobaculum melis]|uniref:D-alanine--D-alanyl carrier protein ligase n=1 Tax=Isobaculum melis TaxID=142588 RepID=A0A1H9T868_9LACT|nr:D-alanine--poly(phosphoribitol) ligase subunit DltA [Isobaculum melis]SER93435.1 D-alanine--poly(phosphoribitol) ligase subunit 1 [Isobaculum melis]
MKTIIEQMNDFAEMSPDTLCYDSIEKTHTYGELKWQSNQLANAIIKKVPHLDGNMPVLIYGEITYEMVVSFIAALKVGMFYVPVDKYTPMERIKQIFDIAQPELIISLEALPFEATVPVLTLEEVQQVIEQKEVLNLPVYQTKDTDRIYAIFTSGTTGVPKGVQINHRNLLSFTDWIATDFQVGKQKRFLCQAPFSFDLSVMDLYPALLSGGTLVPVQKQVTDNFKKLFAYLPETKVNVWVSTPSFMEICLLEKTFDALHYPELTTFLFCGEELTNQTAKQLKERFPEAAIYNTYGPTEATVAVTQVLITDEVLAEYPRLPIGFVKEDTQMLIKDDEGNTLPDGEVGEMVIVGPSVSIGYLNNEEKTAEAFYLEDGVQAYRTGDLGFLKEGLLFYQGRKDFQIKLHGYRIELEDVDHHLENVSLIKAAIAVPQMKENKVANLAAFVVAQPHTFEKEYQLTAAIKKELAESTMAYMIPQKWIYLDELPLTANGKIDRKTLMNEVNQ